MAEVKLLGFWASPFSDRVIWALKLKGINYEYVEEDPYNKTQLLLQHNPVHKKVPVLIHAGKPIAESSMILEYIEETWPQNPLLPQGAYEKAMAHFWIKFGEEKMATICAVLRTAGAEQERAIKEAMELLKILEEQGLGDKKFFGGDAIGLADIAFGWLAYLFGVIEEVAGVKVLDANRLPRLHAWIDNLKEVPVIKENLPDGQKLLGHLKRRRETHLALPNCNN
ncbi:hypothetical protein PVL29_006286 [Vitis rotundifolia]|uniref:Glutathione S-transferase n=1 Tax=Vitis rotundifolia TaxID=103349 RepID=A0AA39A4L8_VITRO|nr:hypothetical protein PVL29_006286 [Vitis rotundifolia]